MSVLHVLLHVDALTNITHMEVEGPTQAGPPGARCSPTYRPLPVVMTRAVFGLCLSKQAR